MEIALPINTVIKKHEITQSFLGSLFIVLCSLIWIPTLPVPVTLQTFALFIIALMRSPKIAFGSSVFYLLEASLGLPVLRSCSTPLWMLEPCAGYLIAFPFASYIMSMMAYKQTSIIKQVLGLSGGLFLIYFVGFLWLSNFIGIQSAFKLGVVFFIPIDFTKMVFALAITRKTTSSSS